MDPSIHNKQAGGHSSVEAMQEDNFRRRLEFLASTAKGEKDKQEYLREVPEMMKMYGGFLRNRKKVIDWSKIRPPANDMVLNYKDIPNCPEEHKQELGKKLVVLKLNGGLGTTMGCTGPKSAIEVRNDLTFLDLTVQQIKVISVHVLLLIQPLIFSSRN
jgi:UTP--glucose-1-phosphate uridylyltransferase